MHDSEEGSSGWELARLLECYIFCDKKSFAETCVCLSRFVPLSLVHAYCECCLCAVRFAFVCSLSRKPQLILASCMAASFWKANYTKSQNTYNLLLFTDTAYSSYRVWRTKQATPHLLLLAIFTHDESNQRRSLGGACQTYTTLPSRPIMNMAVSAFGKITCWHTMRPATCMPSSCMTV
jgi:hypothetical protein